MTDFSLAGIPDVAGDVDQLDARGPSVVQAGWAAMQPSRRTMLRGAIGAAVLSTLVPLEWVNTRRQAAAAGPMTEFTGPGCNPPYSGYVEEANNWWSGGAKRCFGGWRMGGYPCNSSHWHFEGFRSYSDEGYTSNRLADTCGGRNAWRWSNGEYRCSDAWTRTVWNSGEAYEALTISHCYRL